MVLLELVASVQDTEIQNHFDKLSRWKRNLKAFEAWAVIFTLSPKKPTLWPAPAQKISCLYIQHDYDFNVVTISECNTSETIRLDHTDPTPTFPVQEKKEPATKRQEKKQSTATTNPCDVTQTKDRHIQKSQRKRKHSDGDVLCKKRRKK